MMALKSIWTKINSTLFTIHNDFFSRHYPFEWHLKYVSLLYKLKKKILKPGGIELANDLWKHWGIEGSFEAYMTDRLDERQRPTCMVV